MSNKLIASDVRNQSQEELNKLLLDLRKEQFSLKMAKTTDQEIKTHQFRIVKRNIARVKTILNEK